VGDKIDTSITLSIFFESCFVIYQCYYYLATFCCISASYEHEIIVLDSFLIHRVSLSSKEEVFVRSREKLRRYRYLGLDILFCKYRHTTGDRTDKRNIPDFIAIRRVLWRYLDILERISIEPSFFHDLIEKY
jgi:hypothetical protein